MDSLRLKCCIGGTLAGIFLGAGRTAAASIKLEYQVQDLKRESPFVGPIRLERWPREEGRLHFIRRRGYGTAFGEALLST